ncbi:unnamed protein product [Ostreobium quekettii]|uniref:glycerophosphodiester phosphodiesterase n=1 Tax=Ostreobium quekettii TaxID=121088 RepID=A0A8S1J7V2_9CHLO|nr:unnamed protein product [Ostreobium quekettii]|eukprot:evm.model.scf_1705.1 EVM.evm.TU.scf_1705.1   scf_1705:2996-9113(-)
MAACRTCVATLAAVLAMAMLASAEPSTARPLVISHRGYPCKYPEETIRGYEEAIAAGVDYIEMDVVSTKDGKLITRHDVLLDESTNIKDVDEFKNRTATKLVNGKNITGYFAIDFTLEEIKSLKTRQRLAFRDHSVDGKFMVPTLKEVLQLVKAARRNGTKVGAYTETKHPQFHIDNKRPLEEPLVAELRDLQLLADPGAIYLQSFDPASIKKLQELLGDKNRLPATWLIGCEEPIPTLAELEEFKEYGTAIGPDKLLLFNVNAADECGRSANSSCGALEPTQECIGRLEPPPEAAATSTLLTAAHDTGLEVHAYTFRNEGKFMALDFMSDPYVELNFYANRSRGVSWVDGVFIDCPATSVPWRDGGSWDPSRDSDENGARDCNYGGVVFAMIFLSIVSMAFSLLYVRERRRGRAGGAFSRLSGVEMDQRAQL